MLLFKRKGLSHRVRELGNDALLYGVVVGVSGTLYGLNSTLNVASQLYFELRGIPYKTVPADDNVMFDRIVRNRGQGY